MTRPVKGESSPALFSTAHVHREAQLSGCGRYRYSLLRRWADSGGIVTFVMLNPSTADATQDDPTLRRVMGFARAWNLAGVRVVNLYALRSKDPRDLWTSADPVGPDNDEHLTLAATAAVEMGAPLVAAWGSNARPDRIRRVLTLPAMSVGLTCLETTRAGQPRHPLYLPAALRPRPWALQGGPR